MNTTRIIILAAALSALPLSMACAGGAGGLTWGQQYFDSPLSNYDFQGTFSGAYGYGVTRQGQRIGGFAIAVRSAAPEGAFDGGFAGLITGQEIHAGPFLMAVTLWTGIGGLSVKDPALPAGGSLALFGELDLELGLGFISWMELTGYAGMQAVVRVADGGFFSGAMYTPVLGIRVSWGSF
jgi:hypothetical protein